jgi:chorismate dehydratase
MRSPVTIGIPNLVSCLPLAEGLRHSDLFALVRDQPAVLAHKLEMRALSASYVSPVEYARNASEYRIFPGTAVVSPAGNNSLVMSFRRGIHQIATLAVPPTSASDIILAKILLAERFDIHPRFVPVTGDLESMLAKADAALLAGDFPLDAVRSDSLDLVEEWIATTDLPYVHGFVAAREDALSRGERAAVSASGGNGCALVEAAGGDEALKIARFDYRFSDDAKEGVTEFLRYAYYHGILPDVPELRFFDEPESASEPGRN